jgi:hypothetical protein
MESATVGSNTVAVGDITVSSTNGAATVATTFELISAGGNRSMSGRYKVPSDSHAHIIEWDCSSINTTMDTRLRADTFMDNGISSGAFHFKDIIFLASGASSGPRDMHYEEYPPNAMIKISAIPGNAPAGNKLSGQFSLIVMKGTA